MTDHLATISWTRGNAAFVDNRYSRIHSWSFDGGAEIVASSSPSVIPLPMSSAEAIDPEEAFVASLSSCHMLWFLAMAAQRGCIVDEYVDDAVGTMAMVDGRKRFVGVVLRPRVAFSGAQVLSASELSDLHDEAHDQCYLANSVAFDVCCEPLL